MNIKTAIIATIVAAGCMQFGETSFANGDQTTPSDEQNIPGVAAQPDSYFFTGKVYDAELGGYVFAARVLDPSMGRWTTPDPSGFPDGPNNRIYAPVPTTQIDPTGYYTINNLQYTPRNNTIFGVLTLNPTIPQFNPAAQNNSFTYDFQTNLGIEGAFNGYIVQHVTIQANYYIYAPGGGTSIQQGSKLDYWEAWRVYENGDINYGSEDSFKSESNYSIDGNHAGNISISGEMEFFNLDFFSNQTSYNNPATWVPGAVGNAVNPATEHRPDWDKSYLNTTNHTLSFSWE